MKKVTYSAIGDAIIVRLQTKGEENKTETGIIIPDSVKEDQHFGVIHDIGPDVTTGGLEVGDKVVFSPHIPAGWQNDNGDRFLKMRPQDIWSKVEYQEELSIQN